MATPKFFLSLFVLILHAAVSHQQTAQCIGQLDMVFVVDGSNSMGPVNFQNQIKSLVALIQRLDINFGRINAGAVLFSTQIEAVEIKQNRNDLIQAIQKWTYPDAGTNTHLAIKEARSIFQNGARGGDVPKLLMLITDGESRDRAESVKEANLARNEGISLFAIGVTSNVKEEELVAIANARSNVIITNNFSSLDRILDEATAKACTSLVTTPAPITTPECTSAKVDLAFLLDTSFSITEENFKAAKGYVKNFLQFANIGLANFRVALVTYSGRVSVRFNLLRYTTRQALNDAIDRIPYTAGATGDMAGAFSALRTQVFTSFTGDRHEAANVVIAVIGTKSGVNAARTIPEAEELRKIGVQIYAIGVGSYDSKELDGISSRPLSENRFHVNNANLLTDTLDPVFQQFNKFCETPQPPTACYYGTTDVILMLDVSSTADSLARRNFQTDFGLLKTSLGKFMNVIMDPSVNNANMRMGLVTYSDTASTVVSTSTQFSVGATNNQINNIPNGVAQGQSDLYGALRQITQQPQAGQYYSYIVIITPNSPTNLQMNQVNQEIQRVKSLGYKVVTMPVTGSTTTAINLQALQQLASGSNNQLVSNGYTDLLRSLYSFIISSLCGGVLRPTTPAPTQPPVTTPAPTPPMPACYFGTTDVYLVNEVSRNAEQLSRRSAQNDYGYMKNSLQQFINVIQNPRVTNRDIRMAYIPFSDTSLAVVNTNTFNSVQATSQAIQNAPNGILIGNSNLLTALRRITLQARQGAYKSYVVIVGASALSSAQMAQLRQEAQRIKNLGYAIVTVPVITGSNQINAAEYLQLASGQGYQIQASSYTDLQRSLTDFVSNMLCSGPKGNKLSGLCAPSNYKLTGNDYVALPGSCDEYVQCYYKADGDFDLSVIRACQAGLFWNAQDKICDVPSKSQCNDDPCKNMCSPYEMKGNCRGFYQCKDDVSVPMCCPAMHMFVKGKGCVRDLTNECTDSCVAKFNGSNPDDGHPTQTTEKTGGGVVQDGGPVEMKTQCMGSFCQKKPSWKSSEAYFTTLFSSNTMWYGKPCFGNMEFDALTCDCTAPKYHQCNPDREFNFKDANTVQLVRTSTLEGLTVKGVTYDNNGLVLNAGANFGIETMSKKKNEPFTIKLRYVEADSSLPTDSATILLASDTSCSEMCNGNVIVYITKDFLSAQFSSPDGQHGRVDISTKGLSPKEVKEFTMVYDDGMVSMSVKGEFQQYLQSGEVPKGLHFPCPFLIGSTGDYVGFQGTIELAAIYSCTPAKLH